MAMGDSCVNLARKLKSGELLVNAYKMLADAYGQLHKSDSARYYRGLYFSLNDSVYNIRKFYNARYKLNDYENRLHQSQVSHLNNRISFQVGVIVVVSLLLLLVSILTYIIYKKNKYLKHTQRLLIEKNRDLEAQDVRSGKLLEHYVECIQQSKSGEENTMKSVAPLLNEDDERQLLNKINNVLDDINVISNPDFSLQMLADAVGSNTSYVSRIINTTYQKNFKSLLNERRIREACHKLRDKERYHIYTIQAIYEEVAYKNSASFIRSFKKVYGMTPSVYQRIVSCQENKDQNLSDYCGQPISKSSSI